MHCHAATRWKEGPLGHDVALIASGGKLALQIRFKADAAVFSREKSYPLQIVQEYTDSQRTP